VCTSSHEKKEKNIEEKKKKKKKNPHGDHPEIPDHIYPNAASNLPLFID
jgi:hypothetical protein